jgi:hypothetical protein
MRIAAFSATLLFAFAACTTTETKSSGSPYQQPNALMAGEITRRVEQIPYQHREELLQSLMWLAQTGEQTIPALLAGLHHENPKVRSSCAWVLGRIGDRRVIPDLQQVMKDDEPTVRMEGARTLVLLGDLNWSPTLIEGLDSDRKEVRYLCHEALKSATGHDFGYDHLNENKDQMMVSVLRWRQWWSEYAGDPFFASSYQQKNHIEAQPAQPMGEMKPTTDTDANTNPAKNTVRNTSNDTTTEVPVVEPVTNPAIQGGTTNSTEVEINPTPVNVNPTPVNPAPANQNPGATTPNGSGGYNSNGAETPAPRRGN